MTTGAHEHDHGSLGQEAARLADALTGWLEANDVAATLRTAARRTAAGVAAPTGGDEPLAPECSVCPICQAVRRLRGVRPEVFEHLTVASAALLAAVRTALDGDTDPGAAAADPTSDAAAPADEPEPSRRRPPDVQRIDIR